ncbi:MAG TPA: class I SAM-dependent methyltransferase [Acidimicrobiia bacterium]
MPTPDRPSITDAARRWVEGRRPKPGVESLVHEALTSFVAGSYFGMADRLRRIHEIRRSMFNDPRTIGEAAGVIDSEQTTLDVVARTATQPEKGRLQFHLARSLSPGTIVELGTSIGISAAYLTLGLESGRGGRLVTIDRSVARTTIARRVWSELGLSGIEQILGPFGDVMTPVVAESTDLRLAYIDGNHRRDPTLSYLAAVEARMSSGVVLLDDIRWSDEMEEAWHEIVAQHPSSVDLGWVGLVIVH